MTFVGGDARRAVSELTASGLRLGRTESVRRTLLDTFDGRLAAAGMRVELVEGQGDPVLVVAAKGSAPALVRVRSAPRLAGDFPPGPLCQRMTKVLDVRALAPVATTTAARREALERNRAGKVVARAELYDAIAVEPTPPDGLVTPRWVVVINQLAGYEAAARRTGQRLRSLGLEAHAGDLVDLLRTAGAIRMPSYDPSPAVPFLPDETALSGYVAVLAKLARTIDANLAGTIGDLDPEFLHDFRVAVRRTRSILKSAVDVVDEPTRVARGEDFGWLGELTGPTRDFDVVAIEWPDYVAALDESTREALEPVRHHVTTVRGEHYRTLVRSLRSKRYRDLMRDWHRWLKAGGKAGAGPAAATPLVDIAVERVARAHKQVVRRGRAIDASSPAEALHDVRKRAKELRYLLECFGSLFEPAATKRFVRELKDLQDNLGTFNDTSVHVAMLQALADDLHRANHLGSEGMLALGRLVDRLEREHAAARAEFGGRFASFDTKATRTSLDDLLRSARHR